MHTPHLPRPRPPGCKPGDFVVDFFGNPALFTVSAFPLYPWITTDSMVYHRFCYKSATRKMASWLGKGSSLSQRWRRPGQAASEGKDQEGRRKGDADIYVTVLVSPFSPDFNLGPELRI